MAAQEALKPWIDGGWEIAKIALGGVVASTITLVANGRRHRIDQQQAAIHLGTRLVDIFERYAVACAYIPTEHAMRQPHGPFDFDGIASLPELATLPDDDAGWRALDMRIAIAAQTFGSRIERARNAIGAESYDGTEDEVASATERQAVSLGEAAWQLAGGLRAQYGFPATDVGWDIAEHFSEHRRRFEALDEKRAQRDRLFWEGEAAEAATSQAQAI